MLYHSNQYTPKNLKYIKEKNNLVKNVKKFYEGRKKLLKGLKRKYFRLIAMKYWWEEARYNEEEKDFRNENGLINYKRLARLIDFKFRDINDELVRKQFLVKDLGSLLKNCKG